MEGHLYDGDIIILFNDEDVTGCTARQLTMMIAETSDVTKKFTVLSNTGPVRFQGAEYVFMLYLEENERGESIKVEDIEDEDTKDKDTKNNSILDSIIESILGFLN